MKSLRASAVTGPAPVAQDVGARPVAGWHGWFGGLASRSLPTPKSSSETLVLRQTINRLISGDPDIANQLYAARFGSEPSESFVKLAWLKHFAASGKTLHALYAMDALRNWQQNYMARLETEFASNALLSLAWDGALLARRVGDPDVLLQSMMRLSRMVLQVHPQTDGERLLRGTALLSASVAASGLDGLRRTALDDLARALDGLILADGGHVSRRGDELLRVSLLLLPVAQALRGARDAVLPPLQDALDRILPMLRMLAMEDGGLSLIVSGKPHREAMAAVFAAELPRGAALEQVPHSNMTRIAFAQTLLLSDDRSLEFEFSAAGERLIRAAILSDHRPAQVRSELVRSREGAVLRHDEGKSHRRSLFVAARGNDLRAEDYVSADKCIAIDVADGVTIAPDQSNGSFRLETENRQLWAGLPRGAAVAVEGRRILLLPNAPARDGRINWALKRISA